MSDPSLLDQPGPLRQEDALPVADLAAWLSEEVPGATGTPSVAQYAGGAGILNLQGPHSRPEE